MAMEQPSVGVAKSIVTGGNGSHLTQKSSSSPNCRPSKSQERVGGKMRVKETTRATTTVILGIVFAVLVFQDVEASAASSRYWGPSSSSLSSLPVRSRRDAVFGCTRRLQDDLQTTETTMFPSPLRYSSFSSSLTDSLLSLRGGSDEDEVSDEEADEEESDDEEDDDEELFGDFGLGDDDANEDDFGEDNMIEQMIVAYHKTPPFTKAYLTLSFIATAIGYTINRNEFPPILLLDWKPITTRLQLWRPFTAFLNFGGFGLGYALTVHFVWTYMSTLERLHHRKPYDFWIMIMFGMASMVIGYSALKLSPKLLGHNLSTFMVYVWSRYHEGIEVNMFELFNTKAELLPWFFLAQVRTNLRSISHIRTLAIVDILGKDDHSLFLK